MSDYKTEILNGVLEHKEMSDEELRERTKQTEPQRSTKKLNN